MSKLNKKEQELREDKKKTESDVETQKKLNEERAKTADLVRRLEMSWTR